MNKNSVPDQRRSKWRRTYPDNDMMTLLSLSLISAAMPARLKKTWYHLPEQSQQSPASHDLSSPHTFDYDVSEDNTRGMIMNGIAHWSFSHLDLTLFSQNNFMQTASESTSNQCLQYEPDDESINEHKNNRSSSSNSVLSHTTTDEWGSNDMLSNFRNLTLC